MSRVIEPTNLHTWYAYLVLTPKAFSDERDKNHFLELVRHSREREGLRIFAFVILDDEIHFLIGTKEEAVSAAAGKIQLLLEKFMGKEARIPTAPVCLPVQDKEGFLQTMCKIHRLPLEQQYVNRLEDYWWSSYLAYRGLCAWDFVDTQPVLSCLPKDLPQRERYFLRLHQENYQQDIFKKI